jgi:Leucine-rich repeat (LRR) protein
MSFTRFLSIIVLMLSHSVRAVDFARSSQAQDVLALALKTDAAEGSHKIFCSAVLVHPKVLLTAAHCLREGNRVDSPREYRQKLKDIKIFLGSSSLDGFVSDQLVEMHSFHIHPRYLRDIRGLADIAVIRLKTPLTHLQASIRPIASDYELLKSIKKGKGVEIVGFGFSEQQLGRSTRTQEVFGTQHAGVLKVEGKTSAEVLVVAGDAVDRFGLFRVTPREGDSGGPLFYEHNGVSYLLGVVSRASRFNHGPQGTAFSTIRHWLCWIEGVAQVRLRSDHAPDYCAPVARSRAASLREMCLAPSTSEAYTLHVLKRTLGVDSCLALEEISERTTNLSLDASYLKEIEALKFFPKLQRLILRDNALTDLSALKDLAELSLVDISYNNVRDTTPLSARSWVVGAKRQYHNIARTTFIRMCQDPSVQGEARRTINAILHMFSLPLDACVDGNYELIRRRELTLFTASDLVDFSPLSHLHTLEGLDLSGQKMESFDFLKTLTDLKSLKLNSVPLTQFDFFYPLKNLTHLFVESSSLHHIDFIDELPRLRELHVAGNHIKDFSPVFSRGSTLRVFGVDEQSSAD